MDLAFLSVKPPGAASISAASSAKASACRLATIQIQVTNANKPYGRLTLDWLGNAHPNTRNSVLVTAMETLVETENRYSGIPTIRLAMRNLATLQSRYLQIDAVNLS